MRAGVLQLTVEQYEAMIERGILPETGGYELLQGLVVRKDRSSPGGDPTGLGPLHRLVVALLIELAGRIGAAGRHMQIQLPVVCPPLGEPEPDASIVRGQPRDYTRSHPSAIDTSCVIEVSHSSLQRDRVDKCALYAAAGIRQYLIINLESMTIEVYGEPDAQGYRTRMILGRGDTIVLLLPDGVFEVAAADLLPA